MTIRLRVTCMKITGSNIVMKMRSYEFKKNLKATERRRQFFIARSFYRQLAAVFG